MKGELVPPVQALDGAVVIWLSGELDLSTAPALKEKVSRAIAAGATDVVLDLTEVTFFDSTTLGVVVVAARRLRAENGDLRIVCADQNVRRVFEITGLDRTIGLHATLEEATRVFAAPRAGRPSLGPFPGRRPTAA